MQNIITAQVIGATRYEVEGNKGGFMLIMDEAEGQNAIGMSVMKVSMSYDQFNALEREGFRYPLELQLNVKFRSGQNQKALLHLLNYKRIDASKPASVAKA